MGNPIASNLIGSGHQLFLNDINKKSSENLLEEGGTWCESPKEVTGQSEVIFLSLPSHVEVSVA
uniref:3-hydroxyisobutyrate dehydrogenase n=1 Tax=Candidatus Kentrum sp. FM TaxID=2126340 RepID=A0A450U2R9_9GAMM|nr:MAG: 3-hydroxyisobutyrate dehydrogenase [Candidatus Kentron sp. FM]